MTRDSRTGLFFAKARLVATARLVLTPDGPQPYKVIFCLGDQTLSEHPVATIREGEALVRGQLPQLQFSAPEERPHPEAPKGGISAAPAATD